MTLRLTLCLLLCLSPMGLTGCGNQDPAPPPMDKDIGVYTPAAAPAPPALAPVAPDPLAGGDTLAPADPMGTDQGGLQAPAPAAPDTDDPLASGPKMPTDHSHWLHGDVSDAHVVVTLNDAPLGTFQGPVDKDITMRLRRGVNTVTFAYTPLGSLASARLEVLEGEHDPPIPPLATFNPAAPMDGQVAQPATETFTFIAR